MYWSVHLKQVRIVVCKLYLNKAVVFKSQKKQQHLEPQTNPLSLWKRRWFPNKEQPWPPEWRSLGGAVLRVPEEIITTSSTNKTWWIIEKKLIFSASGVWKILGCSSHHMRPQQAHKESCRMCITGASARLPVGREPRGLSRETRQHPGTWSTPWKKNRLKLRGQNKAGSEMVQKKRPAGKMIPERGGEAEKWCRLCGVIKIIAVRLSSVLIYQESLNLFLPAPKSRLLSSLGRWEKNIKHNIVNRQIWILTCQIPMWRDESEDI